MEVMGMCHPIERIYYSKFINKRPLADSIFLKYFATPQYISAEEVAALSSPIHIPSYPIIDEFHNQINISNVKKYKNIEDLMQDIKYYTTIGTYALYVYNKDLILNNLRHFHEYMCLKQTYKIMPYIRFLVTYAANEKKYINNAIKVGAAMLTYRDNEPSIYVYGLAHLFPKLNTETNKIKFISNYILSHQTIKGVTFIDIKPKDIKNYKYYLHNPLFMLYTNPTIEEINDYIDILDLHNNYKKNLYSIFVSLRPSIEQYIDFLPCFDVWTTFASIPETRTIFSAAINNLKEVVAIVNN